MSIKYSKESRIFRDFRCIPYSDYYYLIRFYEQYYADIDNLPFDEGLIMSYYYASALFETKEYESHIEVANHILEQSIINNIRYIDGEDIYMSLLYKKTYAHLKTGDHKKALELAEQVVRIDINNRKYEKLLYQCYREIRPHWIKPTLMISAVATLLGAVTTVVFSSLYLFLPVQSVIMPYSLLGLAAVGLFATATGHYSTIVSPVNKILSKAKADKKVID